MLSQKCGYIMLFLLIVALKIQLLYYTYLSSEALEKFFSLLLA
jgi:hypothetical protein